VVIPTTDYDRAYFGDDPDLKRTSGYTDYAAERKYATKENIVSAAGAVLLQSTGNRIKDKITWLQQKAGSLANLKILELGCAYGYFVEDARALGLNWTGVDVSAHAISQCAPAISNFVVNQDATAYLTGQGNNAYDVIVSFRFIECFDSAGLQALITQMNRVGKKQIHIIDEAPNTDFYTALTLEQYKANFSWKKGAILIRNEDFYSANPKVVIV